jgi:hypothetical protein
LSIAFDRERSPGPDLFGPGQDLFGPGPDLFGPGQDLFGPGQDLFGPGPDLFGTDWARNFYVSKDKIRIKFGSLKKICQQDDFKLRAD